jgi:glycosyltransferase involved in cell wall biosynthesis
VLDRPDGPTRRPFLKAAERGMRVEECDEGDQGKARNIAVGHAQGRYIAFIDGDDLWSSNWLVEAHKVCTASAVDVVAHPEMNWFFGENNNLLFIPDSRDEDFDPRWMRFANYWDAMAMAPADLHRRFPYGERDVKGGYAYEDWLWAAETLAAGAGHHVARGTIHFKRRRAKSQTMEASRAKVLVRPNPLMRYGYAAR